MLCPYMWSDTHVFGVKPTLLPFDLYQLRVCTWLGEMFSNNRMSLVWPYDVHQHITTNIYPVFRTNVTTKMGHETSLDCLYAIIGILYAV